MEFSNNVIDIESSIKEGGNKFLKGLPRFIIRWMEHFIRQDIINETINRSSHLEGLPFIEDVLDGWNVKVTVKGIEDVPPGGRYIFAANHPVGAMDALAICVAIGRKFGGVISPANELLSIIPNLKPLLLGVNVFGRNSKETAQKLNELFESDHQIMIFPAGEVSRKKGKVISDIKWQKTFITKAVHYNRLVVPVHISGRNSRLFYTVASLRKRLGIKMYVETMFLPREMISQRGMPVTVTFGKPIPPTFFTEDKSQAEWAEEVKKIMYSLPQNNSEQLKQ
jgi:putative hemolysin